MRKHKSIPAMILPYLNDVIGKLNNFELVTLMLNNEMLKLKRHRYVKKLSVNGMVRPKLIRKLRI